MTTLIRSVLLLCVLWLSGCTTVYTTQPIANKDSPVDSKLIGTWVMVDWKHEDGDGTGDIRHEIGLLDIQRKENSNKLVAVSAGSGGCAVSEGRQVRLPNYSIFEIYMPRDSYSCVHPHDDFEAMSDGYLHATYKIFNSNDSYFGDLVGQDEATISKANEQIKKIISFYGIEDETPTFLHLKYFEPSAFEDEIKSGRLKGTLEYSNDYDNLIGLIVTDDPKKLRTFIAGLDFVEDMEELHDDQEFFIRIKQNKD